MRYCGVRRMNRLAATILAGLMSLGIAGCSPTVKIEAPEKPIVINLNVKIEQEVRIRVEKDLESLFESKDKIF
jgi:hypothetical protein